MFLESGRVHRKIVKQAVYKSSEIEVKTEPVDLGNFSLNKNMHNFMSKFF